jgi:mannose-6-phosphate isomerase
VKNIIKFAPIYKERVWGGRALEEFYKRDLPDSRVKYGESWEIVDRSTDQSVVVDGKYTGKTLNELWTQNKEEIFGKNLPSCDRFPLLLKVLDARERLSLQVHPPEILSEKLKAEPKTEMWYVAEASNQAVIYYGLKDDVTESDFKKSIELGSLEDKIKSFPVVKGDFIFLPSGCLHAIGEGIVIFEIQQNSDTTFRVYDWNRLGTDGTPRKLHKEESLMSIDFKDNTPLMGSAENGSLLECPYFNVDILTLEEGGKTAFKKDSNFAIYIVAEGSVCFDDSRFGAGDFFLYPYDEQENSIEFHADKKSTILRTTIPQVVT